MKKLYAELILATAIWGMGFVTAAWAVESIGPIWLSAIRFMIAILLLDLPHRFRWFGLKPLDYSREELKQVFWPGFFLTALMVFQTWGLKYTTPTKCGFITVLYVLFIPLLERVLYGVRFRKILFLWIVLALIGAGLICQAITAQGISPDFLGAFNWGDFLTLLCSLAAAAQFLAISRKVKNVTSPVRFHVYQSFWVVILCSIIAIPVEGFTFLENAWPMLTWISVLQLGIFSSGVAFLIQVRAQRKIPPSTAGLIILLESPWAMLFALLFMKEPLTGMQIMGAALIMVAAIAETMSQNQLNS